MIESTKQCPFCSQATAAADHYCRHCGRNIEALAPAPVAQAESARQLIDREIASYTAAGWRIVSQSESGFQAAEPKTLNPVSMALFVMLPALAGSIVFFIAPGLGIVMLVLFGIGLLIFVGDYAVKPAELRYITADQIRARSQRH